MIRRRKKWENCMQTTFNLNIEFCNWIPQKTTDNMIFWMLSHIYKMEMNNIKSMMSNLILRKDSIFTWLRSYFCHPCVSTLCFTCDIFFFFLFFSLDCRDFMFIANTWSRLNKIKRKKKKTNDKFNAMRMQSPCCVLWIPKTVYKRRMERRFFLIVREGNDFWTKTIPKKHAHDAALSIIKNRTATMNG